MGLFCEKAKAELKEAKLFNDRQRFSMLSALVRALGTIELFKGGKRLNLRLDNPVCKDTFFDLMNRLYKDFPFHNFSKSLISIEGGFLEKLLMDLRIFKKGADGGKHVVVRFKRIYRLKGRKVKGVSRLFGNKKGKDRFRRIYRLKGKVRVRVIIF